MAHPNWQETDLERFRSELLSCADVPAARAFRLQGDQYYIDCWAQVHRIASGSAFTGDPRMRETIAEWVRRCEETHTLDADTAVRMRMCLYPD